MSEKLSELQIIAAAQRSKQVLEALTGLLGVLEDKTGYEQQLSAAKGRVESIGKEEEAIRARIKELGDDLAKAEDDVKSAKAKANKIVSDAEAQADNTRLIAKNEAGLAIQKAQEQASQIVSDASAQVEKTSQALALAQSQLDNINDTIKVKASELSEVQGKLDAAKEEIRRKFLA